MKTTWSELQKSTTSFLLNMDRSFHDRYEKAKTNIEKAGFTNIHRIRGFDKDLDDLEEQWRIHGDPPKRDKDTFLTNKGKQACALGHYHIWKKMIEENIPQAFVFEDDVFFHKYWHQLAPHYWECTPKTFDILYMGSSFDVRAPNLILQAPLYCTHAYFITLEGARKLYDLLLKDPLGTWTIDCQLREFMTGARQPQVPFTWYLWNGLPNLDPIAMRSPKWQDRLKNSGLVFQDETLGSFVNDPNA